MISRQWQCRHTDDIRSCPTLGGKRVERADVVKILRERRVLNLPNVMRSATLGNVCFGKGDQSARQPGERMMISEPPMAEMLILGLTISLYEDFGSSVQYCLGTPPRLHANFTLQCERADGQFVARINGYIDYSNTTNTVSFATSGMIGQDISYSDSFAGDIAELSCTTGFCRRRKNAVQDYLGSKYALTAAPPTPTNLAAIALSTSQVSLSWTGTTAAFQRNI